MASHGLPPVRSIIFIEFFDVWMHLTAFKDAIIWFNMFSLLIYTDSLATHLLLLLLHYLFLSLSDSLRYSFKTQSDDCIIYYKLIIVLLLFVAFFIIYYILNEAKANVKHWNLYDLCWQFIKIFLSLWIFGMAWAVGVFFPRGYPLWMHIDKRAWRTKLTIYTRLLEHLHLCRVSEPHVVGSKINLLYTNKKEKKKCKEKNEKKTTQNKILNNFSSMCFLSHFILNEDIKFIFVSRNF